MAEIAAHFNQTIEDTIIEMKDNPFLGLVIRSYNHSPGVVTLEPQTLVFTREEQLPNSIDGVHLEDILNSTREDNER